HRKLATSKKHRRVTPSRSDHKKHEHTISKKTHITTHSHSANKQSYETGAKKILQQLPPHLEYMQHRKPAIAKKVAHKRKLHDKVIIDDYNWLRDQDWPQV